MYGYVDWCDFGCEFIGFWCCDGVLVVFFGEGVLFFMVEGVVGCVGFGVVVYVFVIVGVLKIVVYDGVN